MKQSPHCNSLCSYCSPLLLQISASLAWDIQITIYVMQNVLSNSGELRLRKYLKECKYHGVGTCLMKIYDSAIIICTKAFIIYITVTVLATSPLDEQSLLSCVTAFTLTITTTISLSGFTCIIMLSMTYGTTLSLFKYSFWIFSTCFQYHCQLSFVTSYTKSLVTCSNFWRCISTVMFSCTSLFNLGSCELYRVRSHVWRQSNCMTMIGQ